jgi:hypothetical protein
MKLDEYTINAKVIPAVLTVPPLVILHHFYINSEVSNLFHLIWQLKLLSDLSFPVAFTYLVMEINRLIAKGIVENIFFCDSLRMPTTNILLHSDKRLTVQYKQLIYKKVKQDFKFSLPTLKQEKKNEDFARKCITEAVALIRGKVKKGRLLIQYNMQYGFIRNVIGGSILAFVVSLFNIYFFSTVFQNPTAVTLSIISSIIYFIPILLSYFLINYYGYLYATSLVQEYLES